MTAYLYRMPSGIAGAISRPHDLTVEPVLLKSDNTFAQYGLMGKYDGEFFVPLVGGEKLEQLAGFFIRPYPTMSTPDTIKLLGGSKNFAGDNCKRGYLTVNVYGAERIKRGDPVYIRTAKATEASPLGSVLLGETDAVKINAYFTGPGDADGNTEIAYKI